MPGKILRKKFCLWALLLACQLLPGGCSNDLLGLFRSNGLDERLREKDSFRYLLPEEMELNLGAGYSFIVVSDTHIENGSAKELEELRDRIIADSEIKFVVITGDITQNGDRRDLEKALEIAASLRSSGKPCYPVIGNHDVYFNNWRNWKELIGSTRYRINGGTATLFMLDSANACFGKEQLDWLERGIKSAEGRVFVFTHANLFTKGPADMQQITDFRERARLCSILSGSCDIMFQGHIHKEIATKVSGVLYLCVKDFRDYKTYCRVTVDGGGVSYRFEKL
ncbi:MAG: metallophosphoesterase [Treponema sp.]|nr:metallophosphoesterase [Treponema sp.]